MGSNPSNRYRTDIFSVIFFCKKVTSKGAWNDQLKNLKTTNYLFNNIIANLIQLEYLLNGDYINLTTIAFIWTVPGLFFNIFLVYNMKIIHIGSI